MLLSWENIFFQLEKKNKNLANLQFLQGDSHPHTHIHVREANWSIIPEDFSFEPVFSTTILHQLAFVGHAFQQRVDRIGRHSKLTACLKGLATGETEG